MRFHVPVLPYELDALQPYMSAETLEYHYGKHHKTYIDKMNQLLEAPTAWQGEMKLEEIVQTSSGPLFNNAAQAWNHTFFWNCLAPDAGGEPSDHALMAAINESFGSFQHFQQQFSEKTIGVFGSGWGWLVKDRATDRLSIMTTSNGDTPITGDQIPLLTCDVWEHAYYIDYRNARPKFLEAFWKLVNWDFVVENFKNDRVPDMTKLMTGQDSAKFTAPKAPERARPQA